MLKQVAAMTDRQNNMISKLRELAANEPWRQFFEWLATQPHNRLEVIIDEFLAHLSIERPNLIVFLRQLNSIGVGQLLIGRRGSLSRFKFAFQMISVGKAALGTSDKLSDLTPEEKGFAKAITSGSARGGPLKRSATLDYPVQLTGGLGRITLPLPFTAEDRELLMSFLKGIPVARVESSKT